jgi:hypothetical protein
MRLIILMQGYKKVFNHETRKVKHGKRFVSGDAAGCFG